ncbi:Mu transposase-like protein [Cytobacillus oceanisediminis]|uniref:Mu transposase-like protein n=1 Tax=Cytobacillus oceanisediminis TaxID=665099 RepID=A0A2V3AAP0_9BACI|nr:ATP-binding protein [Cytobacillus oceanisediminis]PWW30564.1 Mu transposase-like protein [Cytobacillus oceanisediminis]
MREFEQFGLNSFRDRLLNSDHNSLLSKAVVDYVHLDIMVVDEASQLFMGRPWVTIIFDWYSGYPLGVHIGFELPSEKTVLLALKNAILPKEPLLKRYPRIKNNWHAYGVPETLIVGSGLEFTGKHLMETCQLLGINLFKINKINKIPGIRSSFEKFFKTIAKELSNNTSKKSGNIQNKPQISFDLFQEVFYMWLLDIYNVDFNKSVGGSPDANWRQNMKNTLIPVPSENLKIFFMQKGEGKVQQSGLHVLKLTFISSELSSLYRKLCQEKKDTFVEYRIDEGDLSSIYIFDPLNKSFLKVPCKEQEYSQGLSLKKHLQILKLIRAGKNKADLDSLITASKEIESLNENWLKPKIKIEGDRKMAKYTHCNLNNQSITRLAPMDTVERAMELIDQCHHSKENTGEPKSMFLTGPTGSGKTTIIHNYVQKVGREKVLIVKTPAYCSLRSFLENLLGEVGDSTPSKGSIVGMMRRFIDLFHQQGFELIIIDEAQHLFLENNRRYYELLDMLVQLMNQTDAPFVFVGVKSAKHIFDDNVRLYRRVPITLDLKTDEELKRASL